MQGHYHYDADEYCEACLPVPADSSEVALDQGSQDYPAYCCQCHQLLDCSLTGDGVNYVLEYLTGALAKGTATDVEKEWAEMLRNYGLEADQQETLNQFTEKFGCL